METEDALPPRVGTSEESSPDENKKDDSGQGKREKKTKKKEKDQKPKKKPEKKKKKASDKDDHDLDPLFKKDRDDENDDDDGNDAASDDLEGIEELLDLKGGKQNVNKKPAASSKSKGSKSTKKPGKKKPMHAEETTPANFVLYFFCWNYILTDAGFTGQSSKCMPWLQDLPFKHLIEELPDADETPADGADGADTWVETPADGADGADTWVGNGPGSSEIFSQDIFGSPGREVADPHKDERTILISFVLDILKLWVFPGYPYNW